jgi:hypothetical protein
VVTPAGSLMPGTTSNRTSERAIARTSATTDSWLNGSPATRWTTVPPAPAASTSVFAISSGPPSTGTGSTFD